jgi:hypothetical protein
LVQRFKLLTPGQREECLDSLGAMIRDTTRRTLAGDAARGIERLGQEMLVSHASILDPLIDCVRWNPALISEYCIYALAALTRQSYGLHDFGGHGAPPFTPEFQSRIVNDWAALRRQLATGHPIFDSWLQGEAQRAIKAVGDSLRAVIARRLPYHPALGYLEHQTSTEPRVGLPGNNEVIFSFAIGNAEPRRAFALPGNWFNDGGLRGIRVLLLRPGIPRPESDPTPNRTIELFPAADADYRERFPSLDLELRFHIVTDDDALRTSMVNAVRAALSGLRQAASRLR